MDTIDKQASPTNEDVAKHDANQELLHETALLQIRAQARERDMIMQALQNQKDRIDTGNH